MNGRIALFTAALATSAIAFPALGQQGPAAGGAAGADNQAQRQQTQQEAKEAIVQDLKTRFPEKAVDIPDREPIELRQTITTLVRDSLEPDRLTNAFTQLSRVNRNELGEVSDGHRQKLSQEIQAFDAAFQQKYNQGLAFSQHDPFTHAALVRVEVKNAEAIGRLPLRPVAAPAQRDIARGQAADEDAQPAAGGQRQYGASASTFGVEEGSKLGLMGLPREGGATRMIVTAIEESRPAAGEQAGEWRLIVPSNLTADIIAENLTQHLADLRQRQNQWPEDADRARDAIGRRVLMAYYNLDPAPRPAAGAAQQPAQPGQPGQPAQPQGR